MKKKMKKKNEKPIRNGLDRSCCVTKEIPLGGITCRDASDGNKT